VTTVARSGGARPPRTPRRPVRRLRILGAFLLAIVALFGLGAMTELLRHPAPGGAPLDPVEGGDPRDEIDCPEPEPREGREREDVDFSTVVRVDSNVLYDCPGTFDESLIRYRGEVVGDVLRRRDGAWVQLNDDIYAGDAGPLPAHRDFRGGNAGVGVFIPHDLAEQISFVGGPRFHGDVLEVVGVFHRVDPEADEVAIIRARQGEVVRPGRPFEDTPLRDRQVVALLLAPLALAIVLWERRAARRA
jgi:hypothetical protein